jgi:hypothetical protein
MIPAAIQCGEADMRFIALTQASGADVWVNMSKSTRFFEYKEFGKTKFTRIVFKGDNCDVTESPAEIMALIEREDEE